MPTWKSVRYTATQRPRRASAATRRRLGQAVGFSSHPGGADAGRVVRGSWVGVVVTIPAVPARRPVGRRGRSWTDTGVRRHLDAGRTVAMSRASLTGKVVV